MPQRKPTLVPTTIALAFASVSWTMSAEATRAPDKCVTGPNASAPSGEHWYYRTDRATNRQCWYLAPHDTTVRARMSERPKPSSSTVRLPPHAPSRTQAKETAFDNASDATEAGMNAPAPWPATAWPVPAKSPGMTPAFEPETPRSADPINATPTPASDRTAELHPAAPAQAPDRPSPAIVAALGLIALSGPTYHTVRWLRRRRARDRWSGERTHRSTSGASYARTETGFSADSSEHLVETLEQVLNEMQAELNGTPDAIRPFTERELSATNRVRAVGKSASGR